MKQQYIDLIKPGLTQQTLYQLSQLKMFVDASLKETVSRDFETEADKIKHLLGTLHDIRDYVLSQTIENSVRLKLIAQINQLEEEELLGNSQAPQEEKSSNQTEDKSAPDPQQLEKEEEVDFESTPDS